MAAATYLTRVIPLLFLSGKTFSPPVQQWLDFIPTAILAALLAPMLLQHEGQWSINHLYFWACLPTFLVAWKTRNLFSTVVAGIVFLTALQLFF